MYGSAICWTAPRSPPGGPGVRHVSASRLRGDNSLFWRKGDSWSGRIPVTVTGWSTAPGIRLARALAEAGFSALGAAATSEYKTVQADRSHIPRACVM